MEICEQFDRPGSQITTSLPRPRNDKEVQKMFKTSPEVKARPPINNDPIAEQRMWTSLNAQPGKRVGAEGALINGVRKARRRGSWRTRAASGPSQA